MLIYEAKLAYNMVNMGDDSRVDTPKECIKYVRSVFDEDPTVEWFVAILLNTRFKAIGRVVITKGVLNTVVVHPREVFKPAIVASAASIVVLHVHPSGNPIPSAADIKITRQLREAGKILGIDVLDHVIAGHIDEDPKGLGLKQQAVKLVKLIQSGMVNKFELTMLNI